MLHEFNVNCKNHTYPVIIAPGSLDQAGELFRKAKINAERVHIVSDDNVWPLYGARLQQSLEASNYVCSHSVVLHGEDAKSLAEVERVSQEVATAKLSRSDCLVALGGGVVGDLTGFIASLMYRGMQYIGMPTTFLAQVDSSVGGKTGVNSSFGKNMLGTFHQPFLVIADATVLSTLPPERLLDGFAEAIKTAAVADEDLFTDLGKISPQTSINEFAYISATCLKAKAAIVEADEKDLGQRMLLNFGHTLGHALEAAGNFTMLSHGEAVALGMRAFAKVGESMQISAPGTAASIDQLLDRFGIVQTVSGLSEEAVLAFAGLDKKAGQGQYKVVFVRQPGNGVLFSFKHAEYQEMLRTALKMVANHD